MKALFNDKGQIILIKNVNKVISLLSDSFSKWFKIGVDFPIF